MGQHTGGETESIAERHEPEIPSGRSCLIVLEGSDVQAVNLPDRGELVIGRAEGADVRVGSRTASRHHARLSVTPESIRVLDLGSHNGTLVNGRRITGAVDLVAGDEIDVCGSLLFVRRAPQRSRRPVHEPVSDLAGAIDRSVNAGGLSRGALLILERTSLEQVADLLGPADLVSADAVNEGVVAWLPAGDEADALAAAGVALARNAGRGGVSVFPADGSDAEHLLRTARQRAGVARPSQVLGAEAEVSHLRLAERDVFLVDPEMARSNAALTRLALSDLPVLVTGETGTGKELAVAALHDGSPRRAGPLVALNCAALPEGLFESELFGHERGAFTGATAAKPGLLEAAAGGTVFLDEIGELPLAIQAKLLRAVETKRVTRVGAVREQAVDFRIVAATHRDLAAEVEKGRFRRDLLFRVCAATVTLPPLRARPLELQVLARIFLADACRREDRVRLSLSRDAAALLGSYSWPGNVRELRNLMEYLAATVLEGVVLPWHLPEALRGRARDRAPAAADGTAPQFRCIDDEVRELERSRMQAALAAAGGVHARAAQLIGMPVRTYFTKLKRYGLVRDEAK